MPKLAADYNPAVSEALVRLGELSGSVARALDRDAIVAARMATVSTATDAVVLKHELLRSTPRLMRTEILRHAWRRAGWPEASMSADRWRRLASLIGRERIAPCSIGASVELSSDGSFVLLRRLAQTFANARSSARLDVDIPLVVPGHTNVPWAGCSIDARTGDDCDQVPAELVDFGQVAGGLFVRRCCRATGSTRWEWAAGRCRWQTSFEAGEYGGRSDGERR